jgi:hypothetical protein
LPDYTFVQQNWINIRQLTVYQLLEYSHFLSIKK